MMKVADNDDDGDSDSDNGDCGVVALLVLLEAGVVVMSKEVVVRSTKQGGGDHNYFHTCFSVRYLRKLWMDTVQTLEKNCPLHKEESIRLIWCRSNYEWMMRSRQNNNVYSLFQRH